MFLDSCAVVNLYASAHFEAILSSLDGTAAIVDLVKGESQYVRSPRELGNEEFERIHLDAAIANGLLQLHSLGSESEFELYLELGMRLDDGEAATLALAAFRSGTLITDDRKALSIAQELSVPTLTTPDVVHRWANHKVVPAATLCQALENIRWRARYEPNRRHPLWSWWHAAIEAGQASSARLGNLVCAVGEAD
jgi:predicted nucleic acid-binding protein